MSCIVTVRGTTVALISLLPAACPVSFSEPELVAFERLGNLAGGHIEPIELVPGRAHEEFADEILSGGAENQEDWLPALEFRPGEGERAFAYVLIGCTETSAELEITEETISANLTGSDDVCDAPEMFLTVFSVDADAVPEAAELE